MVGDIKEPASEAIRDTCSIRRAKRVERTIAGHMSEQRLRMSWLCALLLLTCLSVATRGHLTEMEEVEDLLKSESQIDLKSADKLILLVGSTGVGKSTLAKFLIGDRRLGLKAAGSSFIFVDGDAVGTNIRKSMTVVPNVYKDTQSNEWIVDCPGFSDTREAKYEIANAFFIKKVMEHAKKVKIVVVENHFSVTEGMDRFGFSRLLRALAELVPDIERLKGSMGLVATKADRRGNADFVKADLLQYLLDFRRYLEQDLDSKANATVRGMIRALDVLSSNHPAQNVAFFWKPMPPTAGRLALPDLLADSLQSIRSLVFDKLAWADNTRITYSYSLTKESSLFIKHTLAPASVQGTTEELRVFFVKLKESVQSKIAICTSEREKKDLVTKLQQKLDSIGNLTNVEGVLDLTQRLVADASVEKINADVVKKLAARANFFKHFGVDVVRQLNVAVRTEVRYLGRWVVDTARNIELLLVMEEQLEAQKKAAEEAQSLAAKAKQKSDDWVAKVMMDAKKELERLQLEVQDTIGRPSVQESDLRRILELWAPQSEAATTEQ